MPSVLLAGEDFLRGASCDSEAAARCCSVYKLTGVDAAHALLGRGLLLISHAARRLPRRSGGCAPRAECCGSLTATPHSRRGPFGLTHDGRWIRFTLPPFSSKLNTD